MIADSLILQTFSVLKSNQLNLFAWKKGCFECLNCKAPASWNLEYVGEFQISLSMEE